MLLQLVCVRFGSRTEYCENCNRRIQNNEEKYWKSPALFVVVSESNGATHKKKRWIKLDIHVNTLCMINTIYIYTKTFNANLLCHPCQRGKSVYEFDLIFVIVKLFSIAFIFTLYSINNNNTYWFEVPSTISTPSTTSTYYMFEMPFASFECYRSTIELSSICKCEAFLLLLLSLLGGLGERSLKTCAGWLHGIYSIVIVSPHLKQ